MPDLPVFTEFVHPQKLPFRSDENHLSDWGIETPNW
jgi:hypothetical protein